MGHFFYSMTAFMLFSSILLKAQVAPIQQGMASYYAHDFQGKRTANGELFDMNTFTAAHPQLPFNSLVKVVNLENNLWTIVRINDRGPYCKQRVIDLSKIAAQRLGITRDGVVKVSLEVIGKAERAVEMLDFMPSRAGGFCDRKGRQLKMDGYGVQVGAYREKVNAIQTCLYFESLGLVAAIKLFENKNGIYYCVAVGNRLGQVEADKLLLELQQRGWDGLVQPYPEQWPFMAEMLHGGVRE